MAYALKNIFISMNKRSNLLTPKKPFKKSSNKLKKVPDEYEENYKIFLKSIENRISGGNCFGDEKTQLYYKYVTVSVSVGPL